MIEIDGSAGGGQLLRSALALSAVTGEAVRVTSIRGGRSNPGLRPQHLAAVRLLGRIADADRSDAEVGDASVAFDPGAVEPGSYEVDIGTAGSVSLLFDAVLPLAPALDAPLEVTARGGTDVAWSPPVGYLWGVKLPLLSRFGLEADLEVAATGFYPAGGGLATLRVAPSELAALSLIDRGALAGCQVYSKASEGLADADVADRQAEAATDRLADAGLPTTGTTVEYVETASPGSSIVVRSAYGRSIAGFDALGERSTPAEAVGEEAASGAIAFHGGTAAVDRHMADQLVVHLAIAGGRVAIPAVTDHVETGLDLVGRFGMGVSIDESGDCALLRAEGSRRLHG